MNERDADFAIFKDGGFLLALTLVVGVFVAIGLVLVWLQ
jgi:hypothetical protein